MTQKATERQEKEDSSSACVCMYKAIEAVKPGHQSPHNQPVREQCAFCADSLQQDLHPYLRVRFLPVTKKPLVCTATQVPKLIINLQWYI